MKKHKNTAGLSAGIIVPAHNPDIAVLEDLARRIERVCADTREYRLLLVDDGSTPPIESRLKLKQVEILRLDKNCGKGAALKGGFAWFLKNFQPEVFITLDADLQHPPELIPEFIRHYQLHRPDILVGSRERSLKSMPAHRILSNGITSKIISLMSGQKVADGQCGYRLIRAEILQKIDLRENGFFLESEILIRAGWQKMKIGAIPIPTIYNNEKSAVKNVSDTLNFVRLIFSLLKERFINNV